MNVLLVIWDQDELRYCVLPLDTIRFYKYRKWDGVILGVTKDVSQEVEDDIVDLFDRLGLEDGLRRNKQDLRRYMHTQPPFNNIDLVIRIGWVEDGKEN